MQILPKKDHFETISELKVQIESCFDDFRLPYEISDFNYSFLNPSDNTFEVLVNEHKEKILIPDATHYPFLFRGQQKDHEPCLPTLYRNHTSDLQFFIERLRQVEFKILLDQHPVVNRFFKKYNFKIDGIGLAQHYGLKTDILDLTNDLDIAIFFALCHYNKENDSYEPISEEGIQKAIIFIVLPFVHINPKKGTFLEEKISVIGLQPFERPGVQKGFSIHLEKGESLQAKKYSFNYTKSDSEYYFKKFDNGKKLWVDDVLAKKTKAIASKTEFSFITFNQACKLYLPKGLSKNKLSKQLNLSGINLSTQNSISTFSDLELENIKWKWNTEQVDKCILQIRRRFWNESTDKNEAGKRHEFRTVEMLSQIELLRLIGNRSEIEEHELTTSNKNIITNRDQSQNNYDSGWKKVPGRFELCKSEIFLKREDCLIE
ncbi:MAG: FRG domain-containing protein [Prolixibacteraceae bacterium]